MKDPNFDVAFTIGKFTIYWYAILLAAGIAAAMMIADRRSRKRDVPKDIALDLCILGVPFGVLGARIFACISGAIAWGDFFDLTHPGLSFFGGVAFAALAILTYLKLRKISVEEMLDIAAPGVFAGIGVNVWGDFFNRTNYGPLVEKAAHKWFPLATYGSDLKIHYAAFFYEFLLCVVLIVVYYTVLQKKIRRKADRFLLMALAFCLGRFCIDGIRLGLVVVGSIAFDQLCEIVLAALCIVLLFLNRKTIKEDENEDEAPKQNESYLDEDPEDETSEGKEAGEGDAAPEEERPFTGLN